MNIVILTSFFYPLLNGVSVRVYKDAKALIECGHQVTVVSPHQGLAEFPCVKAGQSIFFFRSGVIKKLRDLHREKPIEVIISQNIITDIIAYWALVKPFKTIHLCQVHGPEKKEIAAAVTNPVKRFLTYALCWYDRKVMKKSAKIIVVEKEIKNWLVEEYRQNQDKIIHIANYPDLSLFKPISEKPHQPFTGGYLGTLQAGRVDPLLEISKKIIDIRFIIVGQGDDADKIKTKYHQTIELTSETDYNKIPNILDRFDLGIIFSLRPEGMSDKGPPMKLFEYLACGIPVLAVNLWELKDLIEDAKVGKVVKVDEMEKAILEIRQNYDQYKNHVSRFREQMRDIYSWEKESQKLESVVKEVRACS